MCWLYLIFWCTWNIFWKVHVKNGIYGISWLEDIFALNFVILNLPAVAQINIIWIREIFEGFSDWNIVLNSLCLTGFFFFSTTFTSVLFIYPLKLIVRFGLTAFLFWIRQCSKFLHFPLQQSSSKNPFDNFGQVQLLIKNWEVDEFYSFISAFMTLKIQSCIQRKFAHREWFLFWLHMWYKMVLMVKLILLVLLKFFFQFMLKGSKSTSNYSSGFLNKVGSTLIFNLFHLTF